MRVLVTRPDIAAARTAARLQAVGHQPVLLPLSRPRHRPDVAVEALAQPYAALAVTSAEALRVLSDNDLLPSLDLKKSLYSVGDATAAAATALGFRTVRTGRGGGQELADLIASAELPLDPPLLYLAGTPRAPAFEHRLGVLGQAFRVADVYEMMLVQYTAEDLAKTFAHRPIDAVLLYSRENAVRFFELSRPFTDLLRDLKVLCLSERTASAVPDAFGSGIRIAGTPDEDALLALL